jgi:hypothetical protein
LTDSSRRDPVVVADVVDVEDCVEADEGIDEEEEEEEVVEDDDGTGGTAMSGCCDTGSIICAVWWMKRAAAIEGVAVRIGRRNGGGRRVMGVRSSRTERRSALLMVQSGCRRAR